MDPYSSPTTKVVAPGHQPVPLGQKLAFGFGMLANQMFPAAMGIFLVVLVKGLGFSPLAWGCIIAAPRLFDALTDPIMGFISDNTRSRWGRRRQYVFLGGLMMGISYIAMWQLHPGNGLVFNFIYFLSMSLVFYLGLTIFSVPFVAMGYEMSEDFHERTKIMAIAQFMGQWAWVIAPWFWVILYDPDWFGSPDAGVRTMSVWVAVPCAILAIIPAIFIRGDSTTHRDDFKPINLKSIGDSLGHIFKSALEAFAIPQFRKLAIATFLVFSSFNVIAGFTFFIIVYHLFGGAADQAGIWPALHGCIGALVTTFLVIPIVAAMAKKVGKKKAFLISQSISILGYILFWFLFVPGKPYLFLIALPFHSFGIGGLFTLMMSMTADVCDLDELNSGERREGIIGAVYWWMVKLGTAVAGLSTGLIMRLVGFDEANATEFAVNGLRAAYSFLPLIGVIGAILVMWKYDLSEESADEVRAQLKARKGGAGE